MPPLSRKVCSSNCFVCCKKFEIEISNEKYKKQSQVCEQFCVLVSRYLNLNNNLNCSKSHSHIVTAGKTMEMFKSGTQSQIKMKKLNSCESCLPLLESICTVYKGWNHLQLRLNRSIQLIAKLMQEVSVTLADGADDDNNFKEALDFRKRFIIEAIDKRSSQDFPHLLLKRLSKNSLQLCRKNENNFNYSLVDDELSSPPIPNVASHSDIKVEPGPEPKLIQVQVEVDEGSGAEDSDSGSADIWQPSECDNNDDDHDEANDEVDKINRDVESNNSMDSPNANENILSNNEISKKLKGKQKRHKCKICGKVFSYKCRLVQHMITHTNSKPLKCRFCPRGFNAGSSRRYHEKKCSKVPCHYKCGICDKEFSQYPTYYRHHKVDHEDQEPRVINLNRVENKNACEICGKVFPKKHRLSEHMNMHTNLKTLKCRYCPRGFNRKSNRLYHENRCDSNPKVPFQYKCGICDKKFSQYPTCFSHQKVQHEGQKARVIKLAKVEEKTAGWRSMTDLADSNDADVTEDQNEAATVKPKIFTESFKCPFCHRSFNRISNRNLHAKRCDSNPAKITTSATTVNRYKCYQCDTPFFSPIHLGEHIEKEHGGQRRFPCKVCGRVFRKIATMRSHNQRKHKNSETLYPFGTSEPANLNASSDSSELYICDICRKVFKSLDSLNTHKGVKHLNPNDTTETFPCQFCGKQYRFKHQRHYHENRYCTLSPANSARFVCEKCGKELATKNALSKHMYHHKLEIGPGFPCSVCGKTFKLSDHRNNHERFHREPAYACGYCGEKFIWNSSCRNHIKSRHKGQPLVGHVVNLLKESLPTPTSTPATVVATVTTETPPVETPILVTENNTESADQMQHIGNPILGLNSLNL